MPLAERIERITKQVEFYFSDENWEKVLLAKAEVENMDAVRVVVAPTLQ